MEAQFEAREPAFWDVVDRRAKMLHVATGFKSADGPVFGRVGSMLFTDPPSNRILKYRIPGFQVGNATGQLSLFQSGSGGARGLMLNHEGRLLICETAAARIVRREGTGKTTVLAGAESGERLNGPADLVYAIDGSIYFSDPPGPRSASDSGGAESGWVYQIDRKGMLRPATSECGYPQGLALGPRQLRLYVSDRASGAIRVFDIRPDGSLAPGESFAEFPSDESAPLGGLKTDEEGRVYAAGPGGIWVFSRQGQHLGTIQVPEQPSHCCWGRQFQGLYITAQSSVYYVPTKIPGTRTF